MQLRVTVTAAAQDTAEGAVVTAAGVAELSSVGLHVQSGLSLGSCMQKYFQRIRYGAAA